MRGCRIRLELPNAAPKTGVESPVQCAESRGNFVADSMVDFPLARGPRLERLASQKHSGGVGPFTGFGG